MEQEKDGIPLSGLREISVLLSCKHENIVELKEVAVGKSLERLSVISFYLVICYYIFFLMFMD